MVTRSARSATWVVAVIAALATGPACGSDSPPVHPAPSRDSKVQDMTTPELEIVVDAKYAMSMGYGHAWKATVREVVTGTLADQQLNLLTLANASAKLYRGHFQKLDEQRGVKLRLHRVAQRPSALAGFVANDGTIWEIVDVQ